jgi:predicted transcriptional regulator of viral defense system
MEHKAEAPDALVARIAARQHRIVTRQQLLGAGLSAEQIRHRLGCGRLFTLHRGVYAVGTADPGHLGHLLSAVFASGARARLSHRSASVLFKLLGAKPGPIDVTVPGKKTKLRHGIHRHSTRSLSPADTTTRLRIPCTTVERVLIDLAALRSPELERAVEEAFVNKLIGRTRMQETLDRANGRAGTAQLRRLLAGLLPQLPFTRSELERRFLKLVATGSLPMPIVNRHEEKHRVDFHWPACKLVVETDGRGLHDNPYAFEEDRRRDLDLELAGWHVVRLTWRQVAERPERVLGLLRKRIRAARSER